MDLPLEAAAERTASIHDAQGPVPI